MSLNRGSSTAQKRLLIVFPLSLSPSSSPCPPFPGSMNGPLIRQSLSGGEGQCKPSPLAPWALGHRLWFRSSRPTPMAWWGGANGLSVQLHPWLHANHRWINTETESTAICLLDSTSSHTTPAPPVYACRPQADWIILTDAVAKLAIAQSIN